MSATGNYIVESDVNNWLVTVEHTEDFATTAVNITTEQLTVTHDIPTATEIKFSSTGALPSPLVAGTTYYVIRVDATHIKVATTPVNAAAGTAANLTSVGSGTHTLDIGSGSSTVDRQAIIDRVEAMVEKVTHDYFYAKSFVVYRDGSGKDKLFLGFVPNILSVTEVKIAGTTLDASWYTFDADSIYLDPEAASESGEDLAELLLRIESEEVLFPKGQGNIKVTGTYGQSSCPVAVKQAAIILARAENDETLYTRYDDVSSDSLGDSSYSRGDKPYLTGVHEADRLLRTYIRKRPMFGVA